MSKNKAFIAHVYGSVQGVGFRFSTVSTARRLKISGYVRNMPDGSVEVMAEGSPENCTRLLEWLKKGPPGAFVREVKVRDINLSGLYRGFTVQY